MAMSITDRQLLLLVHLGLGALYLHGFGTGLAGLSQHGRYVRLAVAGAVVLALAAWASVLTGTYIVYPWYRPIAPPGADLGLYPQRFLLADAGLADWHKFGMEWKEHVGWLSPIFATAVAYVTIRYGSQLQERTDIRRVARVLFALAFFSGLVAGALGAALNKVAPNAFLM